MYVIENVRDISKEGKMCTSMCQIRPPQKVKKNTVNYLCDTKPLIEVSNRIRPTSLSLYIYIYISTTTYMYIYIYIYI